MPDELRNMLLDVNQNGDLGSIAKSEHDPMDMQMQVEQEIMRLVIMCNEAGLEARRRGVKRMETVMIQAKLADGFPVHDVKQIYTDDLHCDDGQTKYGLDAEDVRFKNLVRDGLRKKQTDCVTRHGIEDIPKFQGRVVSEILSLLHLHTVLAFAAGGRCSPRRQTLELTRVHHVRTEHIPGGSRQIIDEMFGPDYARDTGAKIAVMNKSKTPA